MSEVDQFVAHFRSELLTNVYWRKRFHVVFLKFSSMTILVGYLIYLLLLDIHTTRLIKEFNDCLGSNLCGWPRYVVRVVSTKPSTLIVWESPSGSTEGHQTVQPGRFAEIVAKKASEPLLVTCSKPCLVMQYNPGTTQLLWVWRWHYDFDIRPWKLFAYLFNLGSNFLMFWLISLIIINNK